MDLQQIAVMTEFITVDEIAGIATKIFEYPDDDLDFIEVWEAISKFFMHTLADALELCPIHHCDSQICIDDGETECQLRHELPLEVWG